MPTGPPSLYVGWRVREVSIVVDVRDHGWRRSSSCADSACVEVSAAEGVVRVRNSAQPDVELPLTGEQWRSLVDAVKADAFLPDESPAPEAPPLRD
jgi:hypothetical protein